MQIRKSLIYIQFWSINFRREPARPQSDAYNNELLVLSGLFLHELFNKVFKVKVVWGIENLVLTFEKWLQL